MAERRTGRHLAVNVAGSVATLGIGLVVIPLYVHEMGAARYGVLTLAWLLLGYFGFLDFGLSRASANALAKLGPDRGRERAAIIATALALSGVVGLAGSAALLAGGAALFERVVDLPAGLRPEIERAWPAITALLPLALMSGIATGALESRERFATANVLGVAAAAAGQLVPAAAAILVAPTLDVVLPVAALARGATLVLALAVAFRGEARLRPSDIDRRAARRLLGYGGWVTVSAIASPILEFVDQVLIGSLIGVAAVAFYAVPMSLVLRSQFVAIALLRTLFPALSRVGPDEAARLGHGALATLGWCYAAAYVPALIAGGPLLSAWMGSEFAAASGPVLPILILGAWINGLALLPFGLLQARGRPQVPALFHLAEVGPFLLAVWWLTTRYGLAGTATAWTLRVTIDACLLFRASRLPRADAKRLLLPAACLAAAFAAAPSEGASLWPTMGAAVLASVATALLAVAADERLRGVSRAVGGRLRKAARPTGRS